MVEILGLELEEEILYPAAIIYALVAVGLFFVFKYWVSKGMSIHWYLYPVIYIVLMPICYAIMGYMANKD